MLKGLGPRTRGATSCWPLLWAATLHAGWVIPCPQVKHAQATISTDTLRTNRECLQLAVLLALDACMGHTPMSWCLCAWLELSLLFLMLLLLDADLFGPQGFSIPWPQILRLDPLKPKPLETWSLCVFCADGSSR